MTRKEDGLKKELLKPIICGTDKKNVIETMTCKKGTIGEVYLIK